MNDAEFSQTVAKYRGEQSCELQFELAIERLVDGEHCRAICDTLRNLGSDWERRIAVAGLGPSLPDEPGLYMFVWCPELVLHFADDPPVERMRWVLYVGKAGIIGGKADTLRQRYVSEYSKYVGRDPGLLWSGDAPKKREERLAKYLTLRPLQYWFLPVNDPAQLPLLEKQLIKLLSPPLNEQHRPRLKLQQPQPAF